MIVECKAECFLDGRDFLLPIKDWSLAREKDRCHS
jgi:hypothetical protein